MPRTLLISGHYPLPEDVGANIRTMNFVRFFKKRGPVDLAYAQASPGAAIGSPVFGREYRFELRQNGSFKADVLHRLASGIPLPIYEWEARSERMLVDAIREGGYDHILVRYLYSTAPLRSLSREHASRTIVDFDDVLSGSLYDLSYGTESNGLRAAFFRWNRRRLKDYEQDCIRFGAALFCSEQDRLAVFPPGHDGAAFVVPNTFSNPSFATYDWGDGFARPNTLLYVGTLSYEPNRSGLTWFIESVFPRFAAAYPDARLLVVGRYAGAEIQRLCESRPDVELHTDASDVKPFYALARAVVVPVLAGGGTRIKILEAALAQRPILSTPFGAAGLDLVPDRDLLLFDDAEEFLRRYASLQGESSYGSMVRSAREQVLEKYSNAAFDAALERAVARA